MLFWYIYEQNLTNIYHIETIFQRIHNFFPANVGIIYTSTQRTCTMIFFPSAK